MQDVEGMVEHGQFGVDFRRVLCHGRSIPDYREAANIRLGEDSAGDVARTGQDLQAREASGSAREFVVEERVVEVVGEAAAEVNCSQSLVAGEEGWGRGSEVNVAAL